MVNTYLCRNGHLPYLCKPNNLLNRPHMRTQASIHRRGSPQGLMNAPKVVVHVEQRDLVMWLSNFFENALVSG